MPRHEFGHHHFHRRGNQSLHADACRFAADSRTALTRALQCAWRAGQLLVVEKKRVQRSMGAGAWLHWLLEGLVAVGIAAEDEKAVLGL